MSERHPTDFEIEQARTENILRRRARASALRIIANELIDAIEQQILEAAVRENIASPEGFTDYVAQLLYSRAAERALIR
jgi:hypothetical protein